ncbi:MAG: hypothetical protein WC114_13180 [Smithellaceae bacterium]|jgi:hypothetical protein
MIPNEETFKQAASHVYHHMLTYKSDIERAFLASDEKKGLNIAFQVTLRVNPVDGQEILPKTKISFAPAAKITDTMEGRLPKQLQLDFDFATQPGAQEARA